MQLPSLVNIESEIPAPVKIPLKEALLELIWPTRCVGCESPGELLCSSCLSELQVIDYRIACSRCGAPFGHIICTECYSSTGPEQFNFSKAVSALEFADISARMVVLYKNGNEHRLANLMSEYLFDCIPKHWFIWADCICWIPVDKKTLRRRGFDHMQVVAQELSAKLGLPAVHLLEKIPAKDQRKLSRQQRRQNLEGSFYYSEQAQNDLESPGSQSKNHQPTNILLIDDVLTTGATLDIAAQTLLEAGAKEVRVATFTRVW